MEQTFTQDETLSTIDRFKKFAKASSEKFKDTIARIKADRKFASGLQWVDSTGNVVERDGRANLTFNIVDNMKNAIVNPMTSSPYTIQYNAIVPNESLNDVLPMLNTWVKNLQAEENVKAAAESGNTDSVISGFGYMYATTEFNKVKNKSEIKVYPVEDNTMVIPDPDSIEIDGSDSTRMAMIQHISKRKAKLEYGEEAVESIDGTSRILLADFGDAWKAPQDYVTLVMFYELSDARNSVLITKMIGNKIIAQYTLPISVIPIVTIKGIRVWNNDDTSTYTGIVTKMRDPQTIINYAESQLVERLDLAPKATFAIPVAGLENNVEYYKNINRKLSPLVPYNHVDKKGNPIPAPTRLDNSFPTNDIESLLSSQINLVQSIMGMPLTGITDQDNEEETATSILTKTKSTVSNISMFAQHSKSSMRYLGKILLELYKAKVEAENEDPTVFDISNITVEIGKGPEYVTIQNDAKSKLIAIASMLPPEYKPMIAYRLAEIEASNNPEISKVLDMLKKAMPPELAADSPVNLQLQQQLQQAMQALNNKDKQIQDLSNQIMQLQLRARSDIAIANINANNKLQIEAMKQQGNQDKLLAEAEKEKFKAERDLDLEIAKARGLL